MGFVRLLWKNNVQEAYLPKMGISGQIVSEMLAGYTQKTPYKPFKFRRVVWSVLSITGLRNAHFWQVGLFDIVLSEYPDKSHNFRNFIFMTSHFSALTRLFATLMRPSYYRSAEKLMRTWPLPLDDVATCYLPTPPSCSWFAMTDAMTKGFSGKVPLPSDSS